MKIKLISLLFFFSAISLIFSPEFTVFANNNLDLTIVHTNDIHGRAVYSEESNVIGYSKMKTYISELKATNKNVLLIDAGDTLHGQALVTILKGQTAVDIMNLMEYDFFVPGNHDFNYGYETLIELSKTLKCKTLAANIKLENGSKLFDENSIVEFNGVKVGVFGLATPETSVKANPKNTKGLIFTDPIEVAKEQVKKLKDSGAQLIILISHLGIDPESSGCRSYDVRNNVDGIDLIIDGHSHSELEKIQQSENKAVITSTGSYNKNLGVVNISIKDGKRTITPININFSEFSNVKVNLEIDKCVKKASQAVSSLLNESIGNTEVFLDGKRDDTRCRETNLTKIATDAILKETGADIVLLNGGTFRSSINYGKISQNDVMTVFPFGDHAITKSVKGSDIVSALEFGFSNYPNLSANVPQLAGIWCTLDKNAPVGSRVKEVRINNEKIDLGKNYVLATTGFVANGGDGYTMIGKSKEISQYSRLDEIICSYIKNIGCITESFVKNLSDRVIIK